MYEPLHAIHTNTCPSDRSSWQSFAKAALSLFDTAFLHAARVADSRQGALAVKSRQSCIWKLHAFCTKGKPTHFSSPRLHTAKHVFPLTNPLQQTKERLTNG